MSGTPVGMFKEGDKNIPIVARLRMQERAQLADIKNLYVYSSQTNNRVPLLSIATFGTSSGNRSYQRGASTFAPFPSCVIPSLEFSHRKCSIRFFRNCRSFRKIFPPDISCGLVVKGPNKSTDSTNLKIVLMISLIGIYLALLVQFNNAVKPLLVFAAAPYGVIGSLIALSIMHTPFGFMAFLGIASLIGVIVSHVIVLFDFIEEMHAKGEPLEQALPDAGIQRIRPVMITVLATILALFPLALEGGPLWQPLCYAQIGGLAVATFITLLLVPVLYSIFVLDLKIIRWEANDPKRCNGECLKRLKPFRKQPESNENDTHTSSLAAALLLVLTLCLQCAGVAALIEWLRSVLPRAAKIWSDSLGRPGREIDHRNHYSPWPRDPSVGEFLPVAMLSFVGTRLLLLLEQLCHRRLRRRDPSE